MHKLQKPLLGCDSHRLHLAVKNILLLPYSHLLTMVHNVMKKLTNLKKSAALRQKKLRSVLRNETRWSSTYEMLKRYFEIKHFPDTNDTDIAPLLPSAVKDNQLSTLLGVLKDFESVSKKLQVSCTKREVRKLSDSL